MAHTAVLTLSLCTAAFADAVICGAQMTQCSVPAKQSCCCECRKFAEQARHNKQQHRDAQHKHELDTGDAGLFSLINSKLGDKPHGQEASQQQRHEEAGPHTATHTSARPSRFVDASQKVPAAKLQDRRELILQRVGAFAIFACTISCIMCSNSSTPTTGDVSQQHQGWGLHTTHFVVLDKHDVGQ